jgi:hypothetical protein
MRQETRNGCLIIRPKCRICTFPISPSRAHLHKSTPRRPYAGVLSRILEFEDRLEAQHLQSHQLAFQLLGQPKEKAKGVQAMTDPEGLNRSNRIQSTMLTRPLELSAFFCSRLSPTRISSSAFGSFCQPQQHPIRCWVA